MTSLRRLWEIRKFIFLLKYCKYLKISLMCLRPIFFKKPAKLFRNFPWEIQINLQFIKESLISFDNRKTTQLSFSSLNRFQSERIISNFRRRKGETIRHDMIIDVGSKEACKSWSLELSPRSSHALMCALWKVSWQPRRITARTAAE